MTSVMNRFQKIAGKNGRKKMTPTKQEAEKNVDAGVFAQRVEKKAYELYQKKGQQDGHDMDDWLEAERLVEGEMIAGE